MSVSLDPQRILIVRLSAIGDVVHALPVLCALRDALPDAFLAWVVEGRTSELLREHGALDELIVLPRGWLKSPSTVWKLRRQLRRLNVDTAIDLQGLTKSAIAAHLSGAPRRIGFAGRDGRELSQWFNNVLVEPSGTHVIDRNLELLAPLGIARPPVRFNLDGNAADEGFALGVVESLELGPRFGVINPGAGWPSKLWPAERFAAVARQVGRDRGLRWLVVWAGQREREAAETIVAAANGHATLAPATTLCQLAAIARRAAIFVASDTGPLHLAAAVGTPCVGLFGPMPAERNGPYGAQHLSIQKQCLSGSSRQRRNADGRSMAAIAIEDVVGACQQILDRPEPARRIA